VVHAKRPVAAARQRNFTVEWDAALLLNAGKNRWVQVGMRWKHISNGLTAWENPGIDNRMLFAGMSWRVHAPR
jgi:Lipid A 3-O-deacylase (PagL)